MTSLFSRYAKHIPLVNSRVPVRASADWFKPFFPRNTRD